MDSSKYISGSDISKSDVEKIVDGEQKDKCFEVIYLFPEVHDDSTPDNCHVFESLVRSHGASVTGNIEERDGIRFADYKLKSDKNNESISISEINMPLVINLKKVGENEDRVYRSSQHLIDKVCNSYGKLFVGVITPDFKEAQIEALMSVISSGVDIFLCCLVDDVISKDQVAQVKKTARSLSTPLVFFLKNEYDRSIQKLDTMMNSYYIAHRNSNIKSLEVSNSKFDLSSLTDDIDEINALS